ncbi:hypothetical protein [Morganella morganii]|uniref:hypothetical protein n=1 Tax=Morganella morganii TaxID=582 RepID=UPI000BBD089E|nr:hypothetical protein [Morganella morganii]ATF52667.1 hypothetical protein CO693_02610 [Morganella morganii]
MNPEQKYQIRQLLEVPQMNAAQMITLLSVWLDAERDPEVVNMICVALNVAREIDKSLSVALEGKI